MKDIQDNFYELAEAVETDNISFEAEVDYSLDKLPSEIDKYDFVFAVVLGTLGAMLDTNDKVADFLDSIHAASNDVNPTSDNKIVEVLAKLLKHCGDYMDKLPVLQEDGSIVNKFVNRSAKEVAGGVWKGEMNAPHRLFWGHDIFSIGPDNPFALGIKQYGLFKGIIQTFRHLIADTCSKQGLPLPFSSYFDYKKDGGKRGNHLLDFCQKYSEEVFGKKQGGANNEVFNHIFSIHMQDVIASGFTSAGIKAYCFARDIQDRERVEQMRIIAFGFNFGGSALIGELKTSIPYINWICLIQMFKSIISLLKASNENIKYLEEKTQGIINNTEILLKQQNRLDEEILIDMQNTMNPIDLCNKREALIGFFNQEGGIDES